MLIQCPPNQVKQEAAEERKFLKGVKEKQDVDMKQFLSQQKADYRGTKVIYKRVRTYILLYLIKSVINSFIIRLTHANVWESVGKPCSCMQFIKSRIFYYTHLLSLALLLVLCTRNNTDGNKLVIFSGIALYYGDNQSHVVARYGYVSIKLLATKFPI